MKIKNLLLVAVFFVLLANKSYAQADINSAKAVFIYNFLSHIKWPDAEVNDKYVIGVYGKTKTFDYLKSYTASRKVGSKPIEVISLNSAVEVSKCNLVFVANSKRSEIKKINQLTANKSCLIIGEDVGTTQLGAVVAFQLSGTKLKYKLDEENAKSQNLIVSNTLISMSL